MGQNDSVIRVDMSSEWWQKLLSVLVGIAVGIAVILLIAFTAGAAALIASAVIGATVTASIGTGAIIVGVAGGVIAGIAFDNTMYPEDLILPLYSISPEEIFKGNILLFDIDFFNPVDTIKMHTDKVNDDGEVVGEGNVYNLNDYDTDEELMDAMADDEEVRDYFYEDENGNEIITSKQNVALELQSLISQWYVAIRNIAIVLSMSVLLYIGIRMLLSTVAQDKAKYKQMLIDWVVGLCLLFFMHYIMSFSVTIVNQFTEVVAASNNQSGSASTATGYSVTLEEDDEDLLLDKMEELRILYT